MLIYLDLGGRKNWLNDNNNNNVVVVSVWLVSTGWFDISCFNVSCLIHSSNVHCQSDHERFESLCEWFSVYRNC